MAPESAALQLANGSRGTCFVSRATNQNTAADCFVRRTRTTVVGTNLSVGLLLFDSREFTSQLTMFHSTTHYKYWIFSDESELQRRRSVANESFRKEYLGRLNPNQPAPTFLTIEEEGALVSYYLVVLKDFCRKFKPPMPRYVTSSAIQYFKRFYLNNSVMENHPKHIMVTCVFLATKIEEFNVTMQQFVNNIRGDRTKASDIVLNNELLLLHRLNYQLTISHPYRPVEGFLIDIKTRYPECNDPERFRKHSDFFLEKSFSTDACFLLGPNQLALLSIVFAAEQMGENIEPYLSILFDNRIEEINSLRKHMQSLTALMNEADAVSKEQVKQIERKMENYKVESFQDPDQPRPIDDDVDETVSYERYSQYREEQEQLERDYIARSPDHFSQ